MIAKRIYLKPGGMMKLLHCQVVLLALLALGGCAVTPPTDYQYLPSKGAVTVTVVQSLACSVSNKIFVVQNAQPTIAISYSADFTQDPWVFKASGDDNTLADTDVTFARYDDGRLKSVNSVSTGQGETVLKDVVSIAAVAALVVGTPGDVGDPEQNKEVCEKIHDLNKDGVVSITYSTLSPLDFSTLSKDIPTPVPASSGSSELYALISKFKKVGPLQVFLDPSVKSTLPVQTHVKSSDIGDYRLLRLQTVNYGTLSVKDALGVTIARLNVLIPNTDQAKGWDLPVPRTKPFGKSTFVLTLGETGSVTSIEYAKTSSAPGVLNVLSAAATTATPETTAAKVAEIKAQADLIAQNNRLAKCHAQPDQCTP
jgi:hypothetical protein